MLRDFFLAFDEVLEGYGAYYCSEGFYDRLARYDQRAAFIVVEDQRLSGVVTIAAHPEHSADGVSWGAAPASNVYLALWTSGSHSNAAYGGDSGVAPWSRYGRFYVQASGGTFASSRVRVYVAMRDQGRNPLRKLSASAARSTP